MTNCSPPRNQEALGVTLAEQELAGIDIVSASEQTRQQLSRYLSTP